MLAAAVILPALYNTGLAFFKYDALVTPGSFVWHAELRQPVRPGRSSGMPLSVTLVWVVCNVSLQLRDRHGGRVWR